MVKYRDEELDRIFAALADPSRRRLLLALRDGEAAVEELGRPLGLSTPGTLKHLAVLERSGLVATEKIGRRRVCRLEAERLAAAEEWMVNVRAFWRDRLTALAETLEAPDPSDLPGPGPDHDPENP